MGAKLNTFKPDSEKYEDKLQLKKIFARVRVLDGTVVQLCNGY